MKSKQLTEQEQEYIKLDYTLKDPQERIALVNKIIESLPSEKLTKKYLDIYSKTLVIFKNTIYPNETPIAILSNEKNALTIFESFLFIVAIDIKQYTHTNIINTIILFTNSILT